MVTIIFLLQTNRGVTVVVEKVLSIAGPVQNYSGGWDDDSEAGRLLYTVPTPVWSRRLAQFQENANNHISLQTGL